MIVLLRFLVGVSSLVSGLLPSELLTTDANGFQRITAQTLIDRRPDSLIVTKNVDKLPASVQIMPRLMDALIASPQLDEFNNYFGIPFPKTLT